MLVYIRFRWFILRTSRLVIPIFVIVFKYFYLNSSGIAARCTTGLCLSGTCIEQTIGASQFAYCYCNPGWTGTNCNQSLYWFIIHFEFNIVSSSLDYFTCTQVGVFPDTAYCSTGRYYYCPTATGGTYFK